MADPHRIWQINVSKAFVMDICLIDLFSFISFKMNKSVAPISSNSKWHRGLKLTCLFIIAVWVIPNWTAGNLKCMKNVSVWDISGWMARTQQAQGAFVSELFSLPTKKIYYRTKGATQLDSCLNSAVGLFLRSHSHLISECIVCEFACVLLRCLPGNHNILILIND